MDARKGRRTALGVSEVTSLTVMRDARGHRGILKSWFHNKWWFCFFRAKCGLPHYSLKTVGWCRTTDGLLDPKSQAGFHKLLPSKYKHMVAVLAVKCFKMANVVSITRTKEARESRNDWTIYKQDGASVGAFLVKTFVCEWVQWPTGSCKKSQFCETTDSTTKRHVHSVWWHRMVHHHTDELTERFHQQKPFRNNNIWHTNVKEVFL